MRSQQRRKKKNGVSLIVLTRPLLVRLRLEIVPAKAGSQKNVIEAKTRRNVIRVETAKRKIEAGIGERRTKAVIEKIATAVATKKTRIAIAVEIVSVTKAEIKIVAAIAGVANHVTEAAIERTAIKIGAEIGIERIATAAVVIEIKKIVTEAVVIEIKKIATEKTEAEAVTKRTARTVTARTGIEKIEAEVEIANTVAGAVTKKKKTVTERIAAGVVTTKIASAVATKIEKTKTVSAEKRRTRVVIETERVKAKKIKKKIAAEGVPRKKAEIRKEKSLVRPAPGRSQR